MNIRYKWAASWQNEQNGMCALRRLGSAWASESSLCAQWVAKDPSILHADSEDSDQTWRMPRLIWVFAGCIHQFLGFVMLWLIYHYGTGSCSFKIQFIFVHFNFVLHVYVPLFHQRIMLCFLSVTYAICNVLNKTAKIDNTDTRSQQKTIKTKLRGMPPSNITGLSWHQEN